MVELISDVKKIGALLLAMGVFFLWLGFALFCDTALLAIGDLLLLSGLATLFGPSKMCAAPRPLARSAHHTHTACS
jgi:hypothetical protein